MALMGRTLQKMPIRTQIVRQFHREGRDTMTRAERIAQRQTLKERIMSPAGPNAFAVGKGALMGGSALGLGALCFYGLGMNNDTSTILNNSM